MQHFDHSTALMTRDMAQILMSSEHEEDLQLIGQNVSCLKQLPQTKCVYFLLFTSLGAMSTMCQL